MITRRLVVYTSALTVATVAVASCSSAHAPTTAASPTEQRLERSVAELVPDSVTKAALSGTDVSGRSYAVVLSPTQTRALADVFNQLPTAVPMRVGCAMGRTVNVTFTDAQDRWEFVPNCTGIGVTFNQTPQPELESSWDLLPVRDAYYAFYADASVDGVNASRQPNPRDPSPQFVLTEADNGRTVTLRVGTVLRVDLKVEPPTTVWPAISDNDSVVQSLDFNTGVLATSHALFRAVSTGSATLLAPTYPVCAIPGACGAAPVYVFHVVVVPKR